VTYRYAQLVLMLKVYAPWAGSQLVDVNPGQFARNACTQALQQTCHSSGCLSTQ